MLLIIGYLAVAALVVALSVKASEYIDMLERYIIIPWGMALCLRTGEPSQGREGCLR